MKLSENTDQLFTAINKFQSKCPNLEKDKKVNVKDKSGKFLYSFRYASLGNILSTTRQALASEGLSVTQSIGEEGVRTIIAHESGQYLITAALQIQTDGKEQDQGSSVTYKRRYQLAGALRLDADMDDDANTADGNIPDFNNQKASKPKAKPEPKPEKEQPEPKQEVSDDDYDSFIETCESANELINWWKQVLDEGNEAELKEQYEEKVFNRLQDIQ